MGAPADGSILELMFLLPGPPEQIFTALTEPAELARWWGPHGFTTPEIELDVRVGGTYRFGMQPPDGDLFYVTGEFVEVDPPRRLVYTFRWEPPDPDDRETTVALTLRDAGQATEIALRHGTFTTPARLALHRDGWTESLEKLREHLVSSP
jgi:uncharacterized protein YndB with AHSA1/START domain